MLVHSECCKELYVQIVILVNFKSGIVYLKSYLSYNISKFDVFDDCNKGATWPTASHPFFPRHNNFILMSTSIPTIDNNTLFWKLIRKSTDILEMYNRKYEKINKYKSNSNTIKCPTGIKCCTKQHFVYWLLQK